MENDLGLGFRFGSVVAFATIRTAPLSIGINRHTFNHSPFHVSAAMTAIVVLLRVSSPDSENGMAVPQSLVPDPLQDQAYVNKDIVRSDGYLPWCLMGEKGSEKIAHVSQAPLQQKEY